MMLSSTAPLAASSWASAKTMSWGLLLNFPLIAGIVQNEHLRLQPSLILRYAQCGGLIKSLSVSSWIVSVGVVRWKTGFSAERVCAII